MHRPTWVEINLSALKHNLLAIRKRVGQQIKIMGIVKADAYGHGDYEVSKVLWNNGVEMLGIAIIEEGIQLRGKGIKSPLLLFGGFFEEQIEDIIRHDLTPTLYDVKLAGLLSEKAVLLNKVVKVHVSVDTGMGSIGVRFDRAIEFIRCIKDMKNLLVEGIYTHCSSSDEKEKEFTNLQIKRFKDVLTMLDTFKISIPFKHMANSGIIINYSDAYFNMVRPGLLLYGLYSSEDLSRDIGVMPVMSFETKVIHIKEMEPGDVVGYGRTYHVTKSMRVATLPVGYGDGYNHRLSNQGNVIIRGKKAPIIGRVCMDLCFVDVTDITNISVGDEVILYGTQGKETIRIESVAKQLNTIPYEVTCSVSKRVPRIYINKIK